jgi:hypothetical protein
MVTSEMLIGLIVVVSNNELPELPVGSFPYGIISDAELPLQLHRLELYRFPLKLPSLWVS